jgi:hypothetical protein
MTETMDIAGAEVLLTPEEQQFRSDLLNAAALLDVPSALCEQRLFARFGEPKGWPLWVSFIARPTPVIAISSIAAAAAIFVWARHESTPARPPVQERVQVEQEHAAPVSAPAAPVDERLTVWDGERSDLKAAGWSGPDPKTKSIAAVPGVGVHDSVGLRWQAAGSQWMGFGWNWFSWYPRNAGTDVTDYEALVFALRIEAPLPAQRPTAEALMVTLSSSGGTGKKSTASVGLTKYAPATLMDGSWHEITIPMADLYAGAKGFDRKTVWELDFGHWSEQTKTFTATIDDIGFVKSRSRQ